MISIHYNGGKIPCKSHNSASVGTKLCQFYDCGLFVGKNWFNTFRQSLFVYPQRTALNASTGNKYAWRYSKCVAVSFQQSLQYSAIVGGRGKCNTKSSSTVRRVYACFSEYLRHCLADPTSSCCVLCFWHNFRYRFHPNWHLRHTQIPRTLLWWCHIPAQRCCEPAVLQAPGSRPHRGSF